ncbi:MAG TPA: class I poly(R)-hydroxyalkanoic acid synthase [Alphaproteobacteria bacterium]
MAKASSSPVEPENTSSFDAWQDIAPQLWEKQQALAQLVSEQMNHWQISSAPQETLDPLRVQPVWQQMMVQFWAQPDKLFNAQMEFWQRYQDIVQDKPQADAPFDKRFKDPRWQKHPLFSHMRRTYQLLTTWWQDRVGDIEGIDEKTRLKMKFALRQVTDAMSPSNMWWSNPEVLETTLQQRGKNLLNGLEHLLEDMQKGRDERGALKPRITMTKQNIFKVGENLATTPGEVIFENELMQLIQYTPQTAKVYQTPLLIVPPWINKYYILDLQAENSFVRWAVEQGHTVFIISWASATKKHKDIGFSDYLDKGLWAALDAVKRATGERDANVIGYCIGGTLLTMGLAEKAAKHEKPPVKSATFFTTLIDFADAGELCLFTDEPQIAQIESLMAKNGYLEAWHMHTTFNLLRANDMIWSFVVNNYLLGKEPFPFDLLHWNSDSTNIPAKAHSFYLREMYLHNKLVKPKAMQINGRDLDVTKIETPAYFISTREDHIAPWEATYRGAQLFSGDVTFTLAGSGHIAGVVNPPVKNKYGYWTHDGLPRDPEHWLAKASEQPGSWWPHWEQWLRTYAGRKIDAKTRKPGGRGLKTIEPAPGRYVKVKAL